MAMYLLAHALRVRSLLHSRLRISPRCRSGGFASSVLKRSGMWRSGWPRRARSRKGRSGKGALLPAYSDTHSTISRMFVLGSPGPGEDDSRAPMW